VSKLRDTAEYYHVVLERIPPRSTPVFEDEEEQKRVWGRRFGVYNDVGTLKMVMLHRPGDEVLRMTKDKYDPTIDALVDDQEQWYFRSDEAPDLATMQKEHDGLAKVLKDNGVEVVYCDGSPRDPKAMFTRDCGVAVKGGLVICRMGPRGDDPGTGRRGEEAFVMKKAVEVGMPILRTIHADGLFEGGSFCWLNESNAIVGTSYRQNHTAVEQLRDVLKYQGVTLHVMPLTGYSLHIDGVIVMIDHDKAIISVSRMAYWVLDLLKELGIQPIMADPRDKGKSVNCLAISPGKIIMCDDSVYTIEKLTKMGIEVIGVPYTEIAKNGGGIHCSTMPMIRERD
jgi:N-dimethylarginine dimethylaminohydrolase